ncbi:uncharacterized protein LOC134448360 [Engraulis encrasicolus]|uniref:uncharacterized protein LOC134448360 n=1 Tax=Engraulis encrasicolus TaxID=184585 RepID=UPI002FD71EA7
MPAARVGVAASLLAGLVLLLSGLLSPPVARSQAVTGTQDTDTDFSLCGGCFYQETPPQGLLGEEDGASAAAAEGGHHHGLVQRCHVLPGGRRFASLYNSTCGARVYSALRLSQRDNWGTQDEGEESNGGDGEDSEVPIPALLGGVAAATANPSSSPSSTWDRLISRLVRDAGVARCSGDPDATSSSSPAGADLFVLTGSGGLSQREDGGCQAGVLWSAVCCAAPEDSEAGGAGEEGGSRGFSLGVVKGTGGRGGGGGEQGAGEEEKEKEEEERVVSVQELADLVGVAAIFTGFCGETEMDGEVAEFFTEALQALKKELEDADADTQTESEDVVAAEGEQAAGDMEDTAESPQEQEEVMSATGAQSRSGPVDETAELSPDGVEMENETQSSGSFVGGALMYLLSSSVSLLTTPVRPVVSTVTSLPGQMTYVLGEELAVLSSLPGNTVSLFWNILCGIANWVLSAAGLVVGAGELCCSTVYACTSPLVCSLFGACHDGVAGMGQLTWDGVGIFGGVVDNAWSLSKFFGGTLWDHGEGYVGSVLSELGHQAKTVGLGVGKLLWRGGRGVGNVVGAVGGLAGGTVGSVVENVKEAFGDE